MGIPLFAPWIRQNYPDVYKKEFKEKVDLLCLDYNAMIYPCVPHSKNEEDLIENVIKTTKTLIQEINPDKVYIALDGVCPRAKMVQQRYRRFMSANEKNKKKYTHKNTSKDTWGKTWDTNAITPGTLFMKKLNKKIKEELKENIIISDSDQPGEGEHKIIRFIKNIQGQTIMVNGLDADLIILVLKSALKNKIIIRRKNDHNISYIISHDLVKSLKKELGNLDDVIIILSLLGNDFLPEMKAINDNGSMKCEILFQCYKLFRLKHPFLTIVDDNKDINYNALLIFFNILEQYEKKNFSQEEIDETWEYNKEYDKDIVIKNYLKGISWISKYYLDKRKCPSWRWHYSHKISPFITDIIDYLNKENDKISFNWYEDNPLTNIHQLVLVLPPQSLELIPNTYIKTLCKTIFKKNYPEKIEIDFFERDKMSWHQRPNLPDIDFNIIDEYILLFQ